MTENKVLMTYLLDPHIGILEKGHRDLYEESRRKDIPFYRERFWMVESYSKIAPIIFLVRGLPDEVSSEIRRLRNLENVAVVNTDETVLQGNGEFSWLIHSKYGWPRDCFDIHKGKVFFNPDYTTKQRISRFLEKYLFHPESLSEDKVLGEGGRSVRAAINGEERIIVNDIEYPDSFYGWNSLSEEQKKAVVEIYGQKNTFFVQPVCSRDFETYYHHADLNLVLLPRTKELDSKYNGVLCVSDAYRDYQYMEIEKIVKELSLLILKLSEQEVNMLHLEKDGEVYLFTHYIFFNPLGKLGYKVIMPTYEGLKIHSTLLAGPRCSFIELNLSRNQFESLKNNNSG